jgi:hypothetical protein
VGYDGICSTPGTMAGCNDCWVGIFCLVDLKQMLVLYTGGSTFSMLLKEVNQKMLLALQRKLVFVPSIYILSLRFASTEIYRNSVAKIFFDPELGFTSAIIGNEWLWGAAMESGVVPTVRLST